MRACEVLFWREKSGRRELKIVNMLMFVNTTVWRGLFGKSADSLERGTDSADEYMIIDNDLMVNKFISVPKVQILMSEFLVDLSARHLKEFAQFNCGAFVAGVVEGVLESCQFQVCVSLCRIALI
eukprot:Partr_v1_DN24873_c3_g1_i2_m29898 putative trafficking protein particle complex